MFSSNDETCKVQRKSEGILKCKKTFVEAISSKVGFLLSKFCPVAQTKVWGLQEILIFVNTHIQSEHNSEVCAKNENCRAGKQGRCKQL